jgi:repressor LexA
MNLHKTQEKLLDLLSRNLDSPLSMRQLQEQLELSSPSLVHHHINQIEKKGYLKRNPNNPADYQILTTAEEPIAFLNLYGSAKCGPEGTLLSGNPISRIPLPSSFISFSIDQAFLVKAEGNSMNPEIRNEDLVVAKKQNTAENGEIVICSLDGEARIKKFRKITNEVYMLESINVNYDPIVIEKNMIFNIEGVFKGLIRR